MLNELANDIHKDNVERGFYDDFRQTGTLLMLTTSELAEALEADRKDRHTEKGALDCFTPDVLDSKEGFKTLFNEKIKDTFEDELADAAIRLLDMCGYFGIDIDKHIELKLKYNRGRGYKHGKAY